MVCIQKISWVPVYEWSNIFTIQGYQFLLESTFFALIFLSTVLEIDKAVVTTLKRFAGIFKGRLIPWIGPFSFLLCNLILRHMP